MKKHWLPTLLGIVLALSLITLYTVNRVKDDLENRLQNVENQLSALSREQSNVLRNITGAVEESLKKQAAILDRYDCEMGAFDATTLCVPITFTVVPKRTTPDTELFLSLGQGQIPMQRTDNQFSAVVPVDVFSVPQVTVTQRDGEVSQVETLQLWLNLKDDYLPTLSARYSGSWTYSPGNPGVCRFNGDVRVNGNVAPNAGFVSVELLYLLDDEVTKRRTPDWKDANGSSAAVSVSPAPEPASGALTWDNSGFTLEEQLEIPAGKTLTLLVEAVDSYGFVHRTVVQKISINEAGERVDGDDDWRYGEESVYDGQGNLLYNPYEKNMVQPLA